MGISAQVSLYPLGQSDLRPAIESAWRVFDAHELTYHPGAMSTLLEGEEEAIFAALRDAFQAAAKLGGTVMVITVSNACPPLPPQGAISRHA